MTNKVDYLPVWKKGATAEERLSELSIMARNDPQRFSRMVVLYTEEMPNGAWKPRVISTGLHNDMEVVGSLYMAINHVYDRMCE